MHALRHDIARIIAEKTLKTYDARKLSREIAEYLIEENMTADLDAIIREVMAERAKQGFVEVLALSANPLSSSEISEIRKLLKTEFPHAKNFTIDQRIDSSVVGGVKLEMPGEQLDLTLSHKLNIFKRLATAGKGV